MSANSSDLLSTQAGWSALLNRQPAEPGSEGDPHWQHYHALLAAAGAHPARSRPFVLAHVAQSLDGFLATTSGESNYISGAGDFDHLHRLRALFDAVMIGGETARLDNPRLTTRRVAGPNPVRVVVLGSTGLPADHALLNDGLAPTVLAHSAGRPHGALPPRTDPSSDCAQMIETNADLDGRVDLADLLRRLQLRGISRLLVEGGGRLIGALLAARLVDRLQIATAPVLLGTGRPALGALPALPTSAHFKLLRAGDDVIWDCDLGVGTA